MVLGEVNYGLFGLVAGLTAFVGFFNSLFSAAVARYYACAVGRAKMDQENGLEECRQWFSTALTIHTIVPIVMVIVGYPIGAYAVEHWLTIPADRVMNCVWVWRFACLSCFVGMVNVPFQAMYTAKQEIAELTIYEFARTTLNVIALYLMLAHPRDWLVMYAGWTCLLSVVPQMIICARACLCYDECRFKFAYAWNPVKVRELSVFAGFRFLGALAIMVSNQGMAILVNKVLGPTRNASMAVGNTLAGQANTFAAALSGALSPAIANAYGEGNLERVRKLALYACKFSGALVLMFAIPLILEAEEVLLLWLKNPPAESAILCELMLVVLVLENLSCGHYMAIFAVGKIGRYQTTMACSSLIALVLAFGGLFIVKRLMMIGVALVVSKMLVIVVRLYYARKIAGLSAREWVLRAAFPLASASVIALAGGILVVKGFSPSFFRVVMTAGVSVPLFLLVNWFLVFTPFEREMLRSKFSDLSRWRRDA